MSYGIEVRSDAGSVNLHSDYASLVYVDKLTVATHTERFWLGGTGFKGYNAQHFEVGYTSEYIWTPPKDLTTVIPFYKPSYYTQKIAPSNFYKQNDGTWLITIIHNGNIDQVPTIYFFTDMIELSPTITDIYGLNVYNEQQALVFSTEYIPLKIDGTYSIRPPDIIGSNNGHIQPTHANTVRTHVKEQDTMYSFVSLAYGVLSWDRKNSWKESKKECIVSCCGVDVCWKESRTCGSFEARWSSFVASVHQTSSNTISVGYIGEFGGWYLNKDCGGWKIHLGVAAFLVALISPMVALAVVIGVEINNNNLADVDIKYYDTPALPENNFETTIMMTRSSYYE
jgi:hypothetical protein